MKPELFLADLRRKPQALRALADRLREEDPWAFLPGRPARILLLGMGSSAYAGGVVAARLRARGLVAVSELASTDLLPSWGQDTLVVGVSATGSSCETLAALGRLGGGERVVALTNTPGSEVGEAARHTVLLHAGPEEGGVACRSFQHTLVQLLALERHLTGDPLGPLADVVDRAADATEHLLSTTAEWLPPVTDLVDGPAGVHLVAPARRFATAQQGALMIRECPRIPAVGCETGDWAHVDVYLTKNTDYRLLAFAGSAWDDGVHEWTGPRDTRVVVVGGDFPGAGGIVRFPDDQVDDVRLLTEVLVPELAAAHLWLARSSPD